MPQAKRMRSCHATSGSTRELDNAPTEPSISRTTGGIIGAALVPFVVAFEPTGESLQRRTKQAVANMHSVTGKSKFRPKVGLDLGIGPACHIMRQSVLQCIRKIVEPADEVKIQRARVGVAETYVFVDQFIAGYKAQIKTDQLSIMAVLEHDTAAGSVLQQCSEEVCAQQIEVNFTLPEYIEVERVVLVQDLWDYETAASRRHGLDLKGPLEAEFAPDVFTMTRRQSRDVGVDGSEVDRHVGQWLAFQKHEPGSLARSEQISRMGIACLIQQRRGLRHVLDDEKWIFVGVALLQRSNQ